MKVFDTLFQQSIATIFVVYANIQPTAAQGPATDFAAWPSGLLTLMTAAYMGTTADGDELEVSDPASSIRALHLLDFLPWYRRGHDEDYVNEIWIEPSVRLVPRSVDRRGDRSEWQHHVQYSGFVGRLRAGISEQLVKRLRAWASEHSRSYVEASAQHWNQRHIPSARKFLHPQDQEAHLSEDAIDSGIKLAAAFQEKIESFSPSPHEFSLICDALQFYAKISSYQSGPGPGYIDNNVRFLGLREVGLHEMIHRLGNVSLWFREDGETQNTQNDIVRGLYFALGLRVFWRTKQSGAWVPVDGDTMAHGDEEHALNSFDDMAKRLLTGSFEWTVNWSPLNFGGRTRGASLFHLIWGVHHFGSENLSRANPGSLGILSILSDVGSLHKSLGFYCPRMMPSSEDELFGLITHRVEEPLSELGDWIGHEPQLLILHTLREIVVVVIIGFFISLGSGASSWMCMYLVSKLLPKPPFHALEGEMEELRVPWRKLGIVGYVQPLSGDRWLAGTTAPLPYGSTSGSIHPLVMSVGIAASLVAHWGLPHWRVPLGFSRYQRPTKWITVLSTVLASIAGITYSSWFYTIGGSPRRWQSKLSIQCSLLFGSILNVICIINLIGVFDSHFPTPYARWTSEALLWLTTTPFYVIYQDGPIGEREGGRRLLYIWQWFLAASVSMI